jgi:hypothetical protein
MSDTPVIEPRAATGRLTVHPGDTVASTWGNTTFDQTMEVFDTVAARDSQWTTPHDGALAYTLDTQTAWVRRSGAWGALSARAFARGTRTAVWAIPTTATLIPFDGFDDPTNMWVAGQGFKVPVAGIYLLSGQLFGVATAAAQSVLIKAYKNGAMVATGAGNATAGGYSTTSNITVTVRCAANDILGHYASASPALSTTYADSTITYGSVSYLGTG